MIKQSAPTLAPTQKPQKDIWFFAALLLLSLTIAYFCRGFYFLLFADNGAGDLFLRWQEQQYVYRGLYPYYLSNYPYNYVPEIGHIESGGYPAWAFFSGFLIFPNFPWNITRFYQALLNIISLGILGVFAYQIGKPYGKSQALFSVAACFAVSSHATTLGLGQYGILVNAFLIGFYWLFKRHQIWAGILLGLAMGKPNIAASFFLPLLIKNKHKAVFSLFAYIISGTLTIVAITGVDVVSVFRGIYNQIRYFGDHGYTAVTVLGNLGVDPQIATLISGVIVFLVGSIFLQVLSNYSVLVLFAMSSVLGRFALYHRVYDNVMLIFLLAALIALYFKSAKKSDLFIFLLVGISLWIPAKLTDFSIVQVAQAIIWISSLIYLLLRERKMKEAA
jgi:hypothetical protein